MLTYSNRRNNSMLKNWPRERRGMMRVGYPHYFLLGTAPIAGQQTGELEKAPINLPPRSKYQPIIVPGCAIRVISVCLRKGHFPSLYAPCWDL